MTLPARLSLLMSLVVACSPQGGVVTEVTEEDAAVDAVLRDRNAQDAVDELFVPMVVDDVPDAATAPDVTVARDAVDVTAPPDSEPPPPPPPGSRLCLPCASHEECGAGSYCLTNQRTGERICGAPCGTGCPVNYTCVTVSLGGAGTANQCVPTSGSCGAVTPPADVPTVMDVATTMDTGPATVDVPSGAVLTAGTRTVSVGARQAIVYVPTAWRAGMPGLVALHGNGDTAMNFLLTSGLREVADAQGVALVFPVAISGSGPMGVDWDAYTRPASANADVTLALNAQSLLARGGADTRRIFLLGYSQGGYLAYHVAMVGADRFAAVSVVAAGDPLPGLGLSTMAARHIPMSMLIGSGDFGLANAQRTRDTLRAMGFEVRYTELPGVGHCCPLRGRAADEYGWLAMRPLP